MKTYYFVPWFSLILFLAVVSGCRESIGNSATPSATMTALQSSSATSIPSSTAMPTTLLSPTPTLTLIPTLPINEAQAILRKFLSDNGGCRLPCLWGIALGESTYQEVQAILSPLSSISELTSFTSESGAMFPVYADGDVEIYTTVGFVVNPDNHIANHIAFNAEAHRPLEQGGYEDVFDSKFFGDTVSAYALPRVLTEHGVPSSIMIATYGGPLTRGGTGGFDILLLYPDQGILVNYTTQMRLLGANVQGCPTDAHVEMELYPPGNNESFFELLKETDWTIKFSYYQPLEEVTSMSLKEFYETFRYPSSQCIETPAGLWPTQEP